MSPSQKTRKTKAAEKHRRTPDQTETGPGETKAAVKHRRSPDQTETRPGETKAAEKHRRSPDQTKDQSGGEAPPHSRPERSIAIPSANLAERRFFESMKQSPRMDNDLMDHPRLVSCLESESCPPILPLRINPTPTPA